MISTHELAHMEAHFLGRASLVVYSGGMDSFTLLAVANKFSARTGAVTFDYGQRHLIETRKAEAVCESMGLPHQQVKIDLSFLKNNALTGQVDVPNAPPNDEEARRKIWVPSRNLIFLSYAISLAAEHNYNMVVFAAHADDHMPDCTPKFTAALDLVARLANFQPIAVSSPFASLRKHEILRLGLYLNLDYSKTWTCHNAGPQPCGQCGSCQERAEAFRREGKRDPLLFGVVGEAV